VSVHLPIMGNETEYGIYLEHVPSENSARYYAADPSGYAATILVKEIEQTDVCFVDRGLECVEDISAHTLAEEQAQRLHFLRTQEGNRMTFRQRHSAELRQRLGYSGYMLETGARFYTDMGHPEYSTGETTDPRTMVLLQKAGDALVEQCRQQAEKNLRKKWHAPDLKIFIHRNNSDGKGHSYAGHENYLLTPSLFNAIMDYRIKGLLMARDAMIQGRYARYSGRTSKDIYELSPFSHAVCKFFVTRSIITGAGKVGYERSPSASYQITQRGDFIKIPIGPDTLIDRGIINTRDQPLADFSRFRRLHVICGDTNVSELSIYLKAGITSLFFMMLEDSLIQRASGDIFLPLRDPVASFHTVSRDLTLRQPLRLEDGSCTTALAIQMQYCNLAKSFVEKRGLDPIWQDVAQKWESILSGFDTDRFANPWSSSLDWVFKEKLFKRIKERKDVSDAYLRQFELNYHSTDAEKSTYEEMLRHGQIIRIVDPVEIEIMMRFAASDTRAYLRGQLIKRYSRDLIDIGWDYAKFLDSSLFFMENPYMGNAATIAPLLADNPDCDTLQQRLAKYFSLEYCAKDDKRGRDFFFQDDNRRDIDKDIGTK